MHSFTFVLPSKTHIKKFITSTHGDPIRLDLKTDIGFVILATLTSRLDGKCGRGSGLIDHWQDRYKDKIIFKIPFHYLDISRKEVSPYTFALLNRYFENQFEAELNRHIQKSIAGGNTIKKGIENFMDHYGIELEEDISYDAVKKAEYRSRKNLSKKSTRILSPAANELFQ